ncbi:hypothetical protein OBBRIDRAFT_807952 [Obba rivulosa]|uniref:Extracellular metalloproteinase n=1 Tax=Obba rivulosa TaxID=1052685 RepID=A0A8E2DEH8_9APHY|nr:hypothetical protein OBBRIDRAFT_807952 [Obba rivulosa]
MGEGWGDFLVTTIWTTKVSSDYPMSVWAANRVHGIRNYPYSLNETVNPSTYKTLDKPGYWGVHAIGEVWAEMLWTVSQRLIAKHGFVDSLFPPAPLANGTVPAGGFYLPQEFTADYCELWAGFAVRELGPDARVDGRTPWGGGVRTNGFDVPRVWKGADVPDVPDTPHDGDDDDDDDDWLWN